MNQLTIKRVISYLLVALVTQSVNGDYLEQADRAEFENGEHEASISLDSLAPLATSTIECETIHFGLCSNMAYKETKMPNFFGDSNLIEAVERVKQFHLIELVNSNCSPHIHDYICELLTPVCLDKENQREAQRTYKIYPCRSFCRLMKRKCEPELMKLNQRVFRKEAVDFIPGFNCDELPYESNGGSETPTGPCHEITEQQYPASKSMNQSASKGFSPFVPINFPPYITDTSRIDASIIKPALDVNRVSGETISIVGTEKTNPNNLDNQKRDKSVRTQNTTSQLNNYIAGIFNNMVKYSNALVILTLITLLLVFNSRRLGLNKLKSHFSLGRSSSSASSENSRRQLHAAQQPATVYQQSHHVVSPSSSSRSLMLFAGHNKQPPSHQLVPAPVIDHQAESLQKPLDGAKWAPSLFSATYERHQCDNRYLLMQPSSRQQQPFTGHHHHQQQQHQAKQLDDKQQLFDTLESQSSSNQYDYIEISGDQRSATSDQRRPRNQPQQQQQQLFSNILLSSPSRQLYLYGSPQAQRQHQHPHPHQQSMVPPPLPPQSGRKQVHASYLDPNLSPYATPGVSGYQLGGDPQHQRSFQRRTRKNSASSWQHRGAATGVAGSSLIGAAYTSASSSGSDASSPPSSSSGRGNAAPAPSSLQTSIRR